MQNFGALGAAPQTLKTATPHCEFLAMRMLTYANLQTWCEFDLQIKNAAMAGKFRNCKVDSYTQQLCSFQWL